MSRRRDWQHEGLIIAERGDGFQGHVACALDGPLVVLFKQKRADEADDGGLGIVHEGGELRDPGPDLVGDLTPLGAGYSRYPNGGRDGPAPVNPGRRLGPGRKQSIASTVAIRVRLGDRAMGSRILISRSIHRDRTISANFEKSQKAINL